MVVGFIVGVLLVVVGAKVVVEVDLGFVVVVVVPVVSDVFCVFLLLLSFLVFCVFAVNFSDLRFHHFLFSLGVSINLSSFTNPERRKNPNPS